MVLFPIGSAASARLASPLINNLVRGISTVAALSNNAQNGASVLGTLDAPHYPMFLTNNPLIAPWGTPWGGDTADNTLPGNPPDTGVTRNYEFTVTRGTIRPDGVEKSVILINGGYPGPPIEANWGDNIVVTVHNQINNVGEGVSFHWHGLLQKKSPWMDGVPAVSECPIAPDTSFTYTFQADLYGTSWYHSHYSAQATDGLFGPMIIHGPNHVAYDIDLGPVMLTDFYHRSYFEILEQVMGPGGIPKIIPVSVNNLINGKGVFDCNQTTLACTANAGLSKFKLTKGKTHRLRLINAGSDAMQRFSIDGHRLTVIANDFVPIKPYITKVVTLGIGQRTDVLVTADVGEIESSFWMRANISTPCSSTSQPFGLGVLGYDKADFDSTPDSTPWHEEDPGTCLNDDLHLTTPMYSVPAAAATYTQQYAINVHENATGSYLWTVNGASFRADYNAPILEQAVTGNLTFPPESAVYNYGSNESIIFVMTNPDLPPHPMHMHGHNFFVLHQGKGDWDGTIVNPQNPQRRDVIMVPRNGHAVIQIVTDNPGTWPLHCHLAWHVSGGLYITILEHPEKLKGMKLPDIMGQKCKDWDSWSSRNVVDEIDSGE